MRPVLAFILASAEHLCHAERLDGEATVVESRLADVVRMADRQAWSPAPTRDCKESVSQRMSRQFEAKASTGWQPRIPKSACTGLGYEFVKYDTPFPEDSNLIAAWDAMAKGPNGPNGCTKTESIQQLLEAIKEYIAQHMGIELHNDRQGKMELLADYPVPRQSKNKGPAWVDTGGCEKQIVSELADADKDCPNEGACGRSESERLQVHLNLWNFPSCLYFKLLPDPRHLISIMIHELFHVYQNIDCWDALNFKLSWVARGFHEFQASRDEFMRYPITKDFIPKNQDAGRSFADTKYGLNWRLFAYKLADYYSYMQREETGQEFLRQWPQITESFASMVEVLCKDGVYIDDAVWNALPPQPYGDETEALRNSCKPQA